MPNEQIAVIADALVLPVRGVEGGGYSCGVFAADGLAVAASIHRASTRPVSAIPSAAPSDSPVVPGPAEAIFGGVFLNHFGHFLMESLGRLWMVNQPEYRHLPVLVQMPWGGMPFEDVEHFARIILDLLEIDPRRLQIVDRPLRVARLHLPEQLYGFHAFDRPDPVFVDFLRVAQRNIRSMAAGHSLPSPKVFMSRSAWQDLAPRRGIIVGARLFDDYLRSQGWHVVQPETLTFRDQLRIYATADHVLVSEGSAQHSFILLPDLSCRVTVLLRRPDPWDVTRVTKQFGGLGAKVETFQDIEKTHVFGQPSWSGVTVVDYTRISARLCAQGLVTDPFTAWAKMREAQIRDSLRVYIEAIHTDQGFLDFMRKL